MCKYLGADRKVVRKAVVFIALMGVSMFGFAKDYKIIEVEFYEGKSPTPFAASKVPIDQLPDTFEIDTTMNLGENDWRVTDAQPIGKTDFRKTGKLKLYLAKVETTMVDPNELLFSLPTISDSIAGVEDTESLDNVVVFREDDWRQFEFISSNQEKLIHGEFEAIEQIYQQHRESSGFNQLHVRKAIIEPLSGAKISIDSLGESFSVEKEYAGIAFNNTAATIVNGFAYRTRSGWLLWGQVDNAGNLINLNLSETDSSSIEGIAENIDSFAQKHELYIVDWPRLFWGGVGKRKFLEYQY